jgi:uncharacterized membrane protein
MSDDGGGKTTLPTDQLKQELLELAKAARQRAMHSLTQNVGQRLTKMAQGKGKEVASSVAGAAKGAVEDVAEAGTEAVGDKAKEAVGGGGVGGIAKTVAKKGAGAVADKAKQAVGAGGDGGDGGGGGGGGGKVINIVEGIDVGVPVSVAYNQWTQFEDFPDFMKKVEKVDQESDTELSWRAQVLWSHRDWKSTIIEQVPDEKIVWKSEGAKGYVDGAVTFHELSPNLTKILLVLEYYPQGFFEKTGNLWRAPGRRARLELKHFRRHVMTDVILHPEEIQGWRGEIHDSEVTSQEEQGEEEQGEEEQPEQARDEQEQGEQEQQDEEQQPQKARGEQEQQEEQKPRRGQREREPAQSSG